MRAANGDGATMLEIVLSENCINPAPVSAHDFSARQAAAPRMAAKPALCDNPPDHKGGTRMGSAEDQQRNTLLAQLITRIAQHDQDALTGLYDASAGQLYALALRITGEQSSAEEVVSDTYYQIWNQAGLYDANRGRVLVWMMTICRSRALDKLRRRDTADTHPDPQSLYTDPRPDDNSPLNILLATERGSALHSALQALTPRDRLLLSLAFFKGLSHHEIAQETGMPLGSIKSILRRSMQSLRSVLEHGGVSVEELS